MTTKPFTPTQLELPLIDSLGKTKPNGCDRALLNFTHPQQFSYGIPGLDACLCRCPTCNGVWWYSQQMRDRLLKRQNIMRTASPDGEALRDNE